VVFPGKLKHSWEMIDLLIWLHFGYSLWKYTSIGPEYVPIVFFLVIIIAIIVQLIHLFDLLLLKRKFEVEQMLGNKTNYEIFAICHVYHQPFFIFEFRVVFVIFNPNRFRKPPILRIILLLLFLGFLFFLLILQNYRLSSRSCSGTLSNLSRSTSLGGWSNVFIFFVLWILFVAGLEVDFTFER